MCTLGKSYEVKKKTFSVLCEHMNFIDLAKFSNNLVPGTLKVSQRNSP